MHILIHVDVFRAYAIRPYVGFLRRFIFINLQFILWLLGDGLFQTFIQIVRDLFLIQVLSDEDQFYHAVTVFLVPVTHQSGGLLRERWHTIVRLLSKAFGVRLVRRGKTCRDYG